PAPWQWKSTVLSSLESLFQVLRLYRAFPQERLRVFSSHASEGLQEQLRQENSAGGSASVMVARFLQQHLLHSPEMIEAGGAREHKATTSIAVSTRTRLDESGGAARALDEWRMSSLERKRLAQEFGTGGDHDLPYTLALPASLPQILAWMTLLAKVQRGELHP
ncbi:MAG TPA: hypothetical protein VF458_06270, partial [Ktedonobacteraceae bacterium]